MKKDTVLELIGLALENGKTETTNKEMPFEVGKAYFFRTVTYHLTGRVTKIVGDFLVLDDCAWIADDGRFSEAMSKGIDKATSAEIEPYGDEVFLNINSIVDGCLYKYSLPKKQI
jgi:hypothetical protein